MRKLASVQKIDEIKPIEKADKVVMARVLGYECVVKRNEHRVGDLGVYFEVDSLLPDKPEFEFLRDVKFRVKIRKFRGQVSMGLFMPLDILPKGNYKEGDDVTEILEVKNYEKMREDAEEQCDTNFIDKRTNSKFVKFMMQFKLFRKLYLKLNQKHKGNWPSWVAKTDEERLSSEPKLLMHNLGKSFYIAEKIDGCLNFNTELITEKDGKKTIQEICETKYKGKVLSYNHNKDKFVYTTIKNYSIKENNNDWYEISYNNEKIILTGNHLVWLPILNCYREVKYLTENDEFLLIENN
jgi:hypothetical protein